MLVAEEGNRAIAGTIDIHNLAKELVARILCLAFFVFRVMAMLTNQDDTIDGQFAAAKRERFGNRGAEPHGRMPRAALSAQIVLADLIDIERHEIERRMVILTMPAVSIQKTVDNMLGVRVLKITGDDGG
jgi:hypothetical protein